MTENEVQKHEIDIDEIIAARNDLVKMLDDAGLPKNATLVAGMGLIFVEAVKADMMQVMQNLQWIVRIYHLMIANETDAGWRGGYDKKEIN
jgi:hypothetical protein